MRWAIAIIASILSPFVVGAPLADRIPGDAILYVGWQGTKAAMPAYQQSQLKKVADAADGGLTRDYIARAINAASQAKSPIGPALTMLAPVIDTAIDCPTALYIGPAKEPGASGSSIRTMILIDAGANAQEMAAKIQASFANGPAGPDLLARSVGQYVVAGVNIDDAIVNLVAGDASGVEPLAKSTAFVATIRNIDANAVLTCYFSMDAMRGKLDRDGDSDWQKTRDALALQGIHAVACSSGFDGKQWSTQTYVAAPAPRQGLASFFDPKPLTSQILQVIPQDATIALVGQFDLAGGIAQLKKSLAADPRVLNNLQQGLLGAKAIAGVDLENELAASLGSEWAVYASPKIGGSRVLSWVLANRLADPAVAERSLGQAVNALAGMATSGLRRSGMQLPVYTIKRDSLTIHYLGLMAVSPAWAIQDGVLYIGMYPQIVESACACARAKSPSILQNPTVAAAKDPQGRLPGGLGYIDLPSTCADGYGMSLLISRYLMGLSDMMGVQSPPMFIPPLERLQPLLQPSLSISWADDAGWHKRSTEPIPVSDMLASDFTVVPTVYAGIMAAIIIPQFTNASEDAKLSSVLSTTQSLTAQLELYNFQHDGYPDFVRYPNWEQMIQRTDEKGTPSPAGGKVYGPYIASIPINALNGFSGIEAAAGVAPGYRPKKPRIGWVFDTQSHRIYPTDKNGAVRAMSY